MKDLGLQDIPVVTIDASDRLRAVDDGYVGLLAENIAETERLRQPLEVRKVGDRFRLIAGGHRLEAVRRLGWISVPCFVYEASAEEARLAEIDENIVRRELNPLDRAVFLAERKALYEKLHPATKNGAQGGRGGKKNETEIVSFSKDTAERCGLTDRTIRTAVAIATKLAPDVRQALVGTPLALVQKELVDLAKLSPDEQRKVLPLVLGDPLKETPPTFKGVRQAHNSLTGRRDTPAGPDGYQKLLTAWRHATAAERQAFREWLAQEDVLADDTPKLEAVG